MVSAISEKGLYRVAMRSEKGDATATYSFRTSASGRSREYPVRIVPIDGEPWFVAADLCRALGLTMEGGATRHLRNLGEDEVRRFRPNTGRRGGRPNAIISESDFNKLIMRSDKP